MRSVFDILPRADELEMLLAISERERDLLLRLRRVAETADRMRAADEADRAALEEQGRKKSSHASYEYDRTDIRPDS